VILGQLARTAQELREAVIAKRGALGLFEVRRNIGQIHCLLKSSP
jgi:hypothetical protein